MRLFSALPNSSSPLGPPAMPFHTVMTWPWVIAAIFLSLAVAVHLHRRRKNARLPPGPTPLPIVGNVLDFPRKHFGREFAALSKRFGELHYP